MVIREKFEEDMQNLKKRLHGIGKITIEMMEKSFVFLDGFQDHYIFLGNRKMSTVITMDEAIKKLEDMFPTFDEEVLRMVLTENSISLHGRV